MDALNAEDDKKNILYENPSSRPANIIPFVYNNHSQRLLFRPPESLLPLRTTITTTTTIPT